MFEPWSNCPISDHGDIPELRVQASLMAGEVRRQFADVRNDGAWMNDRVEFPESAKDATAVEARKPCSPY
jgi:hypothetical protein